MAAERLRKIKEEPLLDDRIPHPYRESIKELRAITALLEEIVQKLPVAIPPAPPVVVRPPAVLVTQLTKEQYSHMLVESLVESLEKHAALKFADDLHVETIDLGVDRSTPAKIKEFPKLKGIALTIFRCTGTADIYINHKNVDHKVTFDEIEYSQTFMLDWFEVETIYVGNAVQTDKELVMIAWKRTK